MLLLQPPKQIHPTLQHHPTSYTKKNTHPVTYTQSRIASFKRRRPRRQKEAWSSSRTETNGKFAPWNSSTFQVQPMKWQAENQQTSHETFCCFLWGSNDSLSINNRTKKRKEESVSIFPKLYQSKRSTISGYNGYNAYKSTWKQLIKMVSLHMWGHLTVITIHPAAPFMFVGFHHCSLKWEPLTSWGFSTNPCQKYAQVKLDDFPK